MTDGHDCADRVAWESRDMVERDGTDYMVERGRCEACEQPMGAVWEMVDGPREIDSRAGVVDVLNNHRDGWTE